MMKFLRFGLIVGLMITFFVQLATPIGAQPTPQQNFVELPIMIGPQRLQGRITLPFGVSNPPVAIFIHGSGQHNYNSAFGGMAIFRDIAHGLANQGIASIRFNKRYYQNPPTPNHMTIHDETIEDVSHAITFASGWHILGDIYLIGFSQGGIVAPYIAYNHPEVAGIISLAGSPRNFFDIVNSQASFLRYQASRRTTMPVPSILPVSFLIERIMAVDENTLPMTYNFLNSQASALGFPITFLRSMDTIDTPSILPHLNIPFLILQGSEDLQIKADYCFVAWQNLLGYRHNATFILYNGLNHFFAPHRPNLGYSQSRAQARVDRRVINDIAQWINYHDRS